MMQTAEEMLGYDMKNKLHFVLGIYFLCELHSS
jgi:hypothetical protein